MRFPETGIGIYPGLGGTQRTSCFVGKELAKYIIFSGRLISADDALSIRLVDYVFAPNQIDDKILGLLRRESLLPRNKGAAIVIRVC
jgi:enoyl-CoA hydratase/carnithine racemase